MNNKIAFVFPGQGSQEIGMAMDLYNSFIECQAIFDRINDFCNFDLLKLCREGPEDNLRSTLYAQPALFACSALCLTALKKSLNIKPFCVSGHSLGEISALFAAEVIDLETTIQLIIKRAELMNSCNEGAMSAVLGLDAESLEKVCLEYEDINIANYNTPQQQVISGKPEQLKKISEFLKAEFNAKVIPLAVSGAFHSPMIKSANQSFIKILDEINFKDAICPVIQNVNAKAYTKKEEIKENLKKQMTSSVLWVDSVNEMVSLGSETFIELGSKQVLAGLIKKINKDIKVINISDSKSLEKALEVLQETVC